MYLGRVIIENEIKALKMDLNCIKNEVTISIIRDAIEERENKLITLIKDGLYEKRN